MAATIQVSIAQLETSNRVQVRRRTDPEAVARYAEAMKAGAVFPPLVVFRERGTQRYVIADGNHRREAGLAAGLKTLEVDLRTGNEADALEYALSANTRHGLPRSRADIKNGLRLLMTSPTLKAKFRTNTERADVLCLSDRTFQRLLAEWRDEDGGDDEDEIETAEKERARERVTTPNLKNLEKPCQMAGSPKISQPTRMDLNLRDARAAIEIFCVMPFSGADAFAKFPDGFDLVKVETAYQWIGELLGAAERRPTLTVVK